MASSTFKLVLLLLTFLAFICSTTLAAPKLSLETRQNSEFVYPESGPLPVTTTNLCTVQPYLSIHPGVGGWPGNCMLSTFSNNFAPTNGAETWLFTFNAACQLLGWDNGLPIGTATQLFAGRPGLIHIELGGPDGNSPTLGSTVGLTVEAPPGVNPDDGYISQSHPDHCFNNCIQTGECGISCQYWYPC